MPERTEGASGRGGGRARLSGLAAQALRHLARHPARSLLTALTSAVAIAVTVNVISLSYGLDEDLRRDVERFGSTTVDVGRLPVVRPGAPRAPLGPAEQERVRVLLAGLRAALAPRRQVAAVARLAGAPGGDLRVQCLSTTEGYLRTLSVRPLAGRWFEAADRGRAVCVLDAALARRLAPAEPVERLVGARIHLGLPGGGAEHEVLGVLEDPVSWRDLFDAFDLGQTARTLTSSLLSFRNVYLPEGALGDGELSGLSVAFERAGDVDEGVRRLTRLWPRLTLDPEQLGRASVGVFVRRDWMREMGGATALGTFVGNVLWLVVVGVAAVMLATLHLISVRERYDELAVRRAEGARRRDVAWQIGLEGTATALLGGLLGLPLGSAAAAVLGRIVAVPFRFEAGYALAASGVALLLGLLASLAPALAAARLQPARVLARRHT